MTKPREPVSIENTLFRVLGTLEIERCAEKTGRSVGYLRALTDPDKRECLSLEDALKLDLEHLAHDGTAPLFETYARQLDLARAERFGDAVAITRATVCAVKEGGEAIAAMIGAGSPDATDAQRERAAHEVEQAASAFTAALPLLTRRKSAAPP